MDSGITLKAVPCEPQGRELRVGRVHAGRRVSAVQSMRRCKPRGRAFELIGLRDGGGSLEGRLCHPDTHFNRADDVIKISQMGSRVDHWTTQ